MTKAFKINTLILTGVLVVIFTMLGVVSAKKISSLPFGEEVTMAALDDESERVGLINFLVIGIDEDGLRSDTIMLFSYDGYSNRVNILSLPRDTRIKLNGYNQKLNAAIGVGIQNVQSGKDKEKEEELIRQVKVLTGLPVNYFVTIDFDGFIEIIDTLGGIDFNVPYNMNYDDPVQNLHIHLNAGMQHLDGQAAHDFVRFRHNNGGSAPGEYVMGDEGRIYWQQEFIKELFRQKAKPQYFAKITEVFEVISKNVRTNYTMQDLLKHIDILQNIKVEEIGSYELPGGTEYEDYGNGNGIWWYIYDGEETDELVREVFLPRSAEQWAAEQAEKADESASVSSTSEPAEIGNSDSTAVVSSNLNMETDTETEGKSVAERTATPAR